MTPDAGSVRGINPAPAPVFSKKKGDPMFSYSTHGGEWYTGNYGTKGEALTAAFFDLGLAVFDTVDIGRRKTPAEMLGGAGAMHVDSFLEQLTEWCYEYAGDVVDGWPTLQTSDQKRVGEKLQEAVATVLALEPPTFSGVVDTESIRVINHEDKIGAEIDGFFFQIDTEPKHVGPKQ